MPAPLAPGLHRPEDRPPHRMACLRRLEFKRRVHDKRFTELVAAFALALCGAMDKREMLVRACPLPIPAYYRIAPAPPGAARHHRKAKSLRAAVRADRAGVACCPPPVP